MARADGGRACGASAAGMRGGATVGHDGRGRVARRLVGLVVSFTKQKLQPNANVRRDFKHARGKPRAIQMRSSDRTFSVLLSLCALGIGFVLASTADDQILNQRVLLHNAVHVPNVEQTARATVDALLSGIWNTFAPVTRAYDNHGQSQHALEHAQLIITTANPNISPNTQKFERRIETLRMHGEE